MWGPGKLRAIEEWARAKGVDLAESFAYSDSYYDTPMLAAVGHPVVVNPDPRLLLSALLRRWPVVHLDVPAGVPKLPVVGIEPQKALMPLARPELIPFARFDIAGTEHRSPLKARPSWSATIAATSTPWPWPSRWPAGDAPCGSSGRRRSSTHRWWVRSPEAMGGIRVERGTGSDEPLAAAALALEAGELVAMMPEGTIPRGQAFFEPVLKGRWGAARLAAMTGAPVIPVGLWGTERVWPRSEQLPNVLAIRNPPTVRIRVGAPVAGLTGKSPDADTKRIMAAITKLLPAEARKKRTPTPEELARTYPGGKVKDTDEAARRPGTD